MIAPLLIDSRGLLKFGFSLTLIAIFIFGGGFFAGFQQAAAIQQAGNYTQALILPERVEPSEISIASLPPETIAAGEDVDVDEPKVAPAIPTDSIAPVIVTVKKDEQPVKIASLPKTKETELRAASKTLIKNHVSDSKQTPSVEDVVTDNSIITAQPANEDNVATHLVTAFTSKELSKIKYSVQVGMYGKLVNAENMMKMLQAQQFDAYITDYRNKKNEVRYNVRFGYFADRKSAIQRLKKFKSDQVGDGYLVRFSADNIVNLADTTTITEPVVLPANKENTNSSQSEEPSVKNGADNISQVETFSTAASIQSVSNTN